MPDITTTTDTTPPVTPPPNAAAPVTPPSDSHPPTEDISVLQRELSEARKENARARTELKRLQDASKAADDQKLSDLEKATKRLTELEGEITRRDQAARQQALATAAIAAAAKQGWADVEDATRYIDESAVEWDDAGRPKNVGPMLADVLKAKPWLRASYTRTPDLGQGDRGGATLTRAQVAELAKSNPAEFNKRWEAGDFREVMGMKP